jgi:hypothetical protein
MPSEDLAKSAREHAVVLEQDMAWTKGSHSGRDYWNASAQAESKVRARAVAALGFLDQFAGRESQWAMRAHQMYEAKGETVAQAARNLASLLREWSDAVDAGLFIPRQIEMQATRAVASTDLMIQVRALVEDRTVHPAAPIVLAGAALEVALRSAVDELQLTLSEKPGISAYARRLRTEGILSVQDVKDVDQMAGVRNSAAHGQFDDLSRERAGLMEQQVNFFLARLSTLLEGHSTATP